MSRSSRVAVLAVIAALATLPAEAAAQGAPAAQASSRPRVPAAEYGKWEQLSAGDLSPDGKWMAYEVRRVNGTNELRYRQLPEGAEQVVRMAAAPQGAPPTQFTRDSRWLVYTIAPDTAGAGGAGGRGGRGGGGGGGATQTRYKVGIVDLRGGTTVAFEDIQSFAVSRGSSHIALRRYRPAAAPATGGAPAAPASRGADLVVRDLEKGTQVTFGNVADFSWSDENALLAMTVDVEGRTGNGVQVLDAATGTLRSLDASDQDYSGIAWRAKSADLAVFRTRTDTNFADTSAVVLAWRNAGSPQAQRSQYDFSADAGFPADMRIASYRALQWTADGSTLLFGAAPRELKIIPAGRGGAPTPARVQVWHWKDVRQFHQQEVNAAQDRQRTVPVSWSLAANHVVRLSDDPYESFTLSESRSAALVTDQDAYFKDVLGGRTYRDLFRVDIATGVRTPVVTRQMGATAISPSGRFVLYAQKGHWWSFDATTGKKTNLTEKAKTSFVDMEDDHPVPERGVYGLAGWATGETAAIIYDRFDAWRANLDGSGVERLTKGREDSTVHRYVSLDPDRAGGGGFGGGGFGGGAANVIDLTKPVVFSTTGEFNKKSGYARRAPTGAVERLVWRDKAIAGLRKAREADSYLFMEQSFSDSPDYFVTPSSALADAKQVSRTNAFQGDYAWGKQVLMDYKNKSGDKLQMMLTYPANYEPGKKYPMVVYYYEQLSQNFHQYVGPSDRAVYNTQVFSQEGYFVLRPDILFRKRDPGVSGLECVTAAVKTALAAVPDIDPKKVGAMGHSWGGYQSAFYAVHAPGTFSAAIAGAPLTDLISMYGYTSGNSGAGEVQHFETGQERMEVSLWEDRAAYLRNSTVFALDSLRIPLLLEEGDSDGNVNSFQSQELYNFGRRLGKQVVYLVYEGENHNVARAESQRDYQRRQLDWFAHYLKGEPAADWIANGESYQQRQRILKGGTTAPTPVTPIRP